MKKKPFKKYEKETGRKPFAGTMASDSQTREKAYLKAGCNAFDGSVQISTPLSFWTENDIWEYIRKYNVPYSKIYDMGETNTGCVFCGFGCHLEDPHNNRFQRMRQSHPKLYKYCMETLGLKEILEYVGLNYRFLQLDFESNKNYMDRSKGAYITNRIQKDKTEQKIKEAIAQLESEGVNISRAKAKVGRMVNMSREHISRNYSHLFSA